MIIIVAAWKVRLSENLLRAGKPKRKREQSNAYSLTEPNKHNGTGSLIRNGEKLIY